MEWEPILFRQFGSGSIQATYCKEGKMPRGKKSCPQCKVLVGPRLKVCQCGFEFTFKQKVEPRPPVRLPPRVPPKIPPKVEPSDEATPSNDPPEKIQVTITDRDELKQFIAQLKSCYARSDYNGGGYAAFLHHKQGVLQVDVCLEMRIP